MRQLLQTDVSKTTLLIRIMVGGIFSEGIQKFLYPMARGTGRFESMGFPYPEFFGNFIGFIELLAGMMVLMGVLTRVGAFSTITIMSVAIITTKIPIAFRESFGPFVLRDLEVYGFWSMAHELRTDFAMWLGSLFLIIKGGGRWSVDQKLYRAWYSFSWQPND
ncbi:Uncharacterized membrane protein YphA, DoxX/SURF4 family [Gracilimonas mengyeensis]|uniref:Uncharacterized membrane protein YphA, DoxX/SURF4 family n=2 Tax=Gracilimonas mengyeensis TaxID=1302730 RepID=A0A521CVL1_9BACT|nr:Uncharacterized membrane protein YphA, DoxX/SURF4 family [Gracilimonas mengyeensis]